MYKIDQPQEKGSFHKNQQRGKMAAGLMLVTAGGLWLAGEMGANIPHWVFSWEMLLIAIGICIGIQTMFKGSWWFVPVIIGIGFLADEIYPEINFSPFVWPVLIIIIGLLFIFKPRKKWGTCRNWKDEDPTGENLIDSTTVFGGVKKNIISKDFKGGEIVCIFGGAEIDLSQADIKDKAILEITQVFGGTKLIIPSNWTVQHEASAVLGGIEEKRKGENTTADRNKVLILRGTTVFGGIDIRSY